VRAAVQTAEGVYEIGVEDELLLEFRSGERAPSVPDVPLSLPRVIAAAQSGSTVVAVVDRRPPLVVSYDAGVTWTETGGGLPPGRAVAIAADDPDLVLFAARNRLYLSRDGARFWRALAVELPEIETVALLP
jgi:hypothetical protein